MATIKVNTTAVRSAADSLSSINSEINNNFSTVTSAVSKLQNAWSGTAANAAKSKFSTLKKNFVTDSSTSRKTVMDNYVKFLRTSVGENYEITEKNNVTLADMFK